LAEGRAEIATESAAESATSSVGSTSGPPYLHLYTDNGTIPHEHFYVDDGDASTHYSYPRDDIDQLLDEMHRLLRSPTKWRSSTKQWLTEAIASEVNVGSRAIVFGSVEPWVECLLLAAGAYTVTAVEYQKRTYEHPQLQTTTVSELMTLQSADNNHTVFDVAVAHGAFDHDGLGRYGDPLQPDGDLIAMRTAWRALRPGGVLMLSLPIDPDLFVWNLHRRYGARRLARMIAGWRERGRLGWEASKLTEAADHRRRYEPIFILERNASTAEPLPGPEPPLIELEPDLIAGHVYKRGGAGGKEELR